MSQTSAISCLAQVFPQWPEREGDLSLSCRINAWARRHFPRYPSENDCRRAGLKVLGVRKFQGSIEYGISLLKKYKIHIVDCREWRKEQSCYQVSHDQRH